MSVSICSGGKLSGSLERQATFPLYAPLRVVFRATGLTRYQLGQLRKDGTVRAKKIGKEWLYSVHDIIAWFNAGRPAISRDADYEADCAWLAQACGELMSSDASYGWHPRSM